MQTGLGTRLVRNKLWVALLWLPLVLYLIVLGANAIGWWSLCGGLSRTLPMYTRPILLAGFCTWLILAMPGLRQKRGPLVLGARSQPLALGVGAYWLGCLLHLLLPVPTLHPFSLYLSLPDTGPLYWGPFAGLHGSYTLYPPLGPRFVLVPTTEAACSKLVAFLAASLFYQQISQAARVAGVAAKSV
jgi:hypothetical protein